jgi:hypothetical protein
VDPFALEVRRPDGTIYGRSTHMTMDRLNRAYVGLQDDVHRGVFNGILGADGTLDIRRYAIDPNGLQSELG